MAGESPFIKPFMCPACGAPQTIRALGRSTEFGCGNCGALIDLTVEPYHVLRQASALAYAPQLPLGARGTVQGRTYECIGFMVRSDHSEEYTWEEYLLFNPYYGFRWLMSMNGHWNFVAPTFVEDDLVKASVVNLHGRTFKLFLRDSAVVRFVLGEFYWRVEVGDVTSVREFVSPPYTVSVESSGYEMNAALAEYLGRDEVERAFASPRGILPRPTGVFPNQPSPFRKHRTFLLSGFALFVVGLLFTAAFFSRSPELVTTVPGLVTPGNPVQVITTETFKFLDDGNLQFELEGAVDNSWIDADIAIVDAVDQSALETTVGVSYYYGIEDGDRWYEGGRRGVTTLGAVARGSYYFTVQTEAGAGVMPRPIPYTLKIFRHGEYTANFWLALVLGLFPVAWNLVMGGLFEAKRWQLSSEVSRGD